MKGIKHLLAEIEIIAMHYDAGEKNAEEVMEHPLVRRMSMTYGVPREVIAHKVLAARISSIRPAISK